MLGAERVSALREDLETLWEALQQGGPGGAPEVLAPLSAPRAAKESEYNLPASSSGSSAGWLEVTPGSSSQIQACSDAGHGHGRNAQLPVLVADFVHRPLAVPTVGHAV